MLTSGHFGSNFHSMGKECRKPELHRNRMSFKNKTKCSPDWSQMAKHTGSSSPNFNTYKNPNTNVLVGESLHI